MSPQDRTLFAAVMATTAIVRALVLWAMPAGLSIDTDAYRRVALVLRATGVFGIETAGDTTKVPGTGAIAARPTAYRPPLYPLLLAGLISHGKLSPLAVGGLNWVLGIGTAALVYHLGIAWKLGRWSALAALGTAFDPILLHQSTQLMTETLAALLATAALAGLTWSDPASWQPDRRPDLRRQGAPSRFGWMLKSVLTGTVMGLACLCRPTFVPWSGLVVMTLIVAGKIGAAQLAWWRAAGLATGLLLTLLPWGLRNHDQLGRFNVSTTHGGFTLLLGNNPHFYRYLREAPWGAVWRSDELSQAWLARGTLRDPQREFLNASQIPKTDNVDRFPSGTNVRERSENEDDQLAYRLAWRFIRAEPRTFAWSCLVRMGRLWQLFPHQIDDRESFGRGWLRRATGCWYAALLLLVLAALVVRWRELLRPPWLWGGGLCVTFTAVHALYWSDMRMRAPLMPWLCLAAAAGAEAMVRYRRAVRGSPAGECGSRDSAT